MWMLELPGTCVEIDPDKKEEEKDEEEASRKKKAAAEEEDKNKSRLVPACNCRGGARRKT